MAHRPTSARKPSVNGFGDHSDHPKPCFYCDKQVQSPQGNPSGGFARLDPIEQARVTTGESRLIEAVKDAGGTAKRREASFTASKRQITIET